ncbi:HIT family protein, partial [hydrothermal vent metagenome]
VKTLFSFLIGKGLLFLVKIKKMSIFTKIIKGEIPSYKVAENNEFYAFLDINPNAKGHTLVVPKKEVNKLFELDKDTYNGLMDFSREVAIAMKKVISCDRIGMAVIGLEVPHVHVHLIPLQKMEDIQFIKKVKLTPEEFEALAKAIAGEL